MKIRGQVDTRTPEGRAKAQELLPGAKPSKFRNKPVKNSLGSFDSGLEAEWADQLEMLRRNGIIKDLNLDKKSITFPLVWNDVKICDYEADATFTVIFDFIIQSKQGPYKLRKGDKVVLDSKGVLTPVYRLKKKMMVACHKIHILEV